MWVMWQQVRIYLISVILKYFIPERNAIARYQIKVRFYKEKKNNNTIMKVLILKLRILISKGARAKRERGKRQMWQLITSSVFPLSRCPYMQILTTRRRSGSCQRKTWANNLSWPTFIHDRSNKYEFYRRKEELLAVGSVLLHLLPISPFSYDSR